MFFEDMFIIFVLGFGNVVFVMSVVIFVEGDWVLFV